jgi:hypothetical protein
MKRVLALGTTAIPNAENKYCVCAVYDNGDYEYGLLSVEQGEEILPGRVLTTSTGPWGPTDEYDIVGLLRVANRCAVPWTVLSAPEPQRHARRWWSPGIFGVFWYSGGVNLPRSPGCPVEILSPRIVRLGFEMKLKYNSKGEPFYQPKYSQDGEWTIKYDGFLSTPDDLHSNPPCGALLALFVAPDKHSGSGVGGRHYAYLKIGSVLSLSSFDGVSAAVSDLAQDIYAVLRRRVPSQAPQLAYSELRKSLPCPHNEASITRLTESLGEIATACRARWLAPLSSIVVSATTGCPADGYFHMAYPALSLGDAKYQWRADFEKAKKTTYPPSL